MVNLVPVDVIENKIFQIRGKRVMLDRDLAVLYEVETRALNQAVKRNIERFPDDFMFKLTDEEYEILKSQFVTSSWGGSRRSNPYAFTEQGVAMLSGILNSTRAIQVNIQIMRVFTRFRQILLISKDIKQELDEMKRQTNDRFQIVFETLDHLLAVEDQPKRKIGFTAKEKRAGYAVK